MVQKRRGKYWRLVKKPARIALAILMILVGILGLILPILPGWAFLVPGVVLLAPNTRFSRWVKRTARRAKGRWRQWRGKAPGEARPGKDAQSLSE